MHDLYNLIEKIKKAPSMYLGRRSIICLQAFLSGYSVAKYGLGEEPTQQERDFMEFPEWIRKKFNVQTSQSWANIILFYSEDESKALDEFFRLLDEFINRNSSGDGLGEDGLGIVEKEEIVRSS
ncbi:hypothetical protein IQ264_18270 [Phormidium sp. LEGE 05292]|uniref:hypothetical protein n=1 Tax=[Phormidium] sp. LEGE 05292 TaxID=767427 RepID=UPI00187E2B66|nr:hypothetical protein [Phormidium sp. LEGE 05292]MBE9227377.1 hypothetical protein [Phormidium sp. LEGE 05292]